MTGAVLPFKIIPPDLPEVSPWLITVNDHVYEEPGNISGWDYASDIVVERELRLDLPRAAEALSIPEQDLSLEAVLRVGTGGSSLPLAYVGSCSSRICADLEQQRLRVEISGARLSKVLHLDLALILATPPQGQVSPLAPVRQAAILWRERQRVRLEGGQPRFPVAEADFSKLLGADWRDALWYLEADTSDLSAPFDAVVRLFINHHKKDFSSRFAEGDSVTIQAVMADVMGQLTGRVLDSFQEEEGFLEDTLESDSLGSTVAGWIASAFEDMSEARRLLALDRAAFQVRLNALAAPPEAGT